MIRRGARLRGLPAPRGVPPQGFFGLAAAVQEDTSNEEGSSYILKVGIPVRRTGRPLRTAFVTLSDPQFVSWLREDLVHERLEGSQDAEDLPSGIETVRAKSMQQHRREMEAEHEGRQVVPFTASMAELSDADNFSNPTASKIAETRTSGDASSAPSEKLQQKYGGYYRDPETGKLQVPVARGSVFPVKEHRVAGAGDVNAAKVEAMNSLSLDRFRLVPDVLYDIDLIHQKRFVRAHREPILRSLVENVDDLLELRSGGSQGERRKSDRDRRRGPSRQNRSREAEEVDAEEEEDIGEQIVDDDFVVPIADDPDRVKIGRNYVGRSSRDVGNVSPYSTRV